MASSNKKNRKRNQKRKEESNGGADTDPLSWSNATVTILGGTISYNPYFVDRAPSAATPTDGISVDIPTAPVVLPQLPIVYLLGRLTRTYNHHDVPSNYAASIAHVFESHPTMMPVLWEEVKGNADSAEKQYMCIFYIDSIASVGVGLAYYISQEMKTIMELKEGSVTLARARTVPPSAFGTIEEPLRSELLDTKTMRPIFSSVYMSYWKMRPYDLQREIYG